ncbi:MAG TPA: hypothetical protein VEF91_04160 [Verrucomicrobiae bacterium]|nr:hypothetical protein [Verrucomicrobiae bacterium]
MKVKALKESIEAIIKHEFVGKKGRHHMLTISEAFMERQTSF